jgi:hypothetical protein
LQAAGADAKLCGEIEELSTNIMLSCSFQDLTGQRTSKVVHALRYIEQRVNSMIQIWGVNARDAGPVDDVLKDTRRDAHLLNGPAKAGEGVSQDDIDKLLSGEAPEHVAVAAPAPAPAPKPAAPVFAAKGAAKPTPVPEAVDDAPAAEKASQADIDALFD